MKKQKSSLTPRRRSQCFFGLHFDFHCSEKDTKVGGRTTPAMVRSILRAVAPDYVQIDCKGHPGFSSYPTKVGIAGPGIVRDQLAVWRKETRAAGLPLVMHYSGVQDGAALQQHPTWAAVGKEGKPDKIATSVFGPYVDELLIPQLVELAVEREVDAAWVDGEVWGVLLDWSRWSKAAWKKSHGKLPLPTDPSDPHWLDFVDHCRDGFRSYLKKYVDALHVARPGFEIASNWAYSTHMPEALSHDVDFISGDFVPAQSVQSARLQGRFLMHQGKPWDLMAWGFGWLGGPWIFGEKTAVQLKQEAALAISLGGGFQIYTQQQRDGFVAPARLPVLAEVARFCREREALCHRAQPVEDVSVLASHEDWRRRAGSPFPGVWPGLHDIEGVLRLCLDARYQTGVLMDHQLADRLDAHRVVVLPDCHHLTPAVRERLLVWLRGGGRILALGPNALAALAIPELPISPVGDILEGDRQMRDPKLAGGAEFVVQNGAWQTWTVASGARVLNHLHASPDLDSAHTPGAVSCRVGRGRLVAVACAMGTTYKERASSVSRELIAYWLRHLEPKPLVEVHGAGRIEVAVMKKDGELRVHLTNLEGPHDAINMMTWDHIPPIGPLEVRLRIPPRKSVRWEPLGLTLPAKQTDDGVLVQIPKIDIHGALVLPSNIA